MVDENLAWTRQREAFWRAHHEAWKRSDLNQRQYCEAEGIPLKAFGNWRSKFKAEPQPPERNITAAALLVKRRQQRTPVQLLSSAHRRRSAPDRPVRSGFSGAALMPVPPEHNADCESRHRNQRDNQS
jgi:hypothetical protein